MKKYLLFMAAFALLLVGCAQNDIVENRSEKNAIGFSSLNDKTTRAANADNANYGVFAKWSKEANKWFMEDVEIKGADNSYVNVPYYWPHEGKVTFYSYAPKGKGTIDENATDKLEITYTVPTGAQEDFTVADPIEVDVEVSGFNGATAVDLQFRHMLSKITVDAELDTDLTTAGFTMDFTSAELIVLKNKGTVDLQATSPKPALTIDTDAAAATYKDVKSYMFLPQPSAGITLQLKGVDIKKDGADYWSGDMKVYTFAGTEGNLGTNFQPNYHYAITFTVKADAKDGTTPENPVFGETIAFTSTLVPWDTNNTDVGVNQPGN